MEIGTPTVYYALYTHKQFCLHIFVYVYMYKCPYLPLNFLVLQAVMEIEDRDCLLRPTHFAIASQVSVWECVCACVLV